MLLSEYLLANASTFIASVPRRIHSIQSCRLFSVIKSYFYLVLQPNQCNASIPLHPNLFSLSCQAFDFAPGGTMHRRNAELAKRWWRWLYTRPALTEHVLETGVWVRVWVGVWVREAWAANHLHFCKCNTRTHTRRFASYHFVTLTFRFTHRSLSIKLQARFLSAILTTHAR